jgi:iron(III) transport system substrate-binding protein
MQLIRKLHSKPLSKLPRRPASRLALFVVTLLLVIGFGYLLHPPSAPAQGQVINLYSTRHYNTDRRLYDDFTTQTGIRVNLVEIEGAGNAIQRIKSEGANSPADILLTVDAGNLWRAQQEGLFQPIKSKVLESKIPAHLRDPEGHWFGFSRRIRVIYYNKERVNFNDVKTYDDLADPKFRGRVVMRSSSNIYNQSFVASLIARQGVQKAEEWARGVVANFARPPAGNDTSNIRDVAAGVGDLTMGNTYYFGRLANSNRPEDQEVVRKVGMIFPDQQGEGAHVNISGGGVLKTSRNKAAAIRFLEYLVSDSAQSYFADGNFEFPVVAGVKINDKVRGFGVFRESKLNASELGKNQAEAVRVLDRAGWK